EVLPIVMHGTRSVLKDWRFNWKNTITLKILDPISVEQLQEANMRELVDATREEMISTLETLKKEGC
ncbi:MAG: hypothetical protein J6R73_00675, partial [Alistipes sp.]|nr:hypothetical protein [Alistipes sp.]